MNVILVDNEFKGLCPALSREEFRQLEENVRAEGCLDPLIVWQGKAILLDGHNRYRICEEHKLPFATKELSFDTRDDAKAWIIKHQLGRRNLTPAQADYLRGKRYELEKKLHGGDRKSSVQNEHLISGKPKGSNKTRNRIARECGVGEATIGRNLQFSKAVDAIAEHGGEEVRKAILAGEVKMTSRDVAAINAMADPEIERVAKVVAGGTVSALKEAIKVNDNGHDETEASCVATSERSTDGLPEGTEVFDSLIASLKDAKKLASKLRESKAAKYLSVGGMVSVLNKAIKLTEDAKPYSVCPACMGSRCRACGFNGFVNRLLFDNIQKGG